MIIWGVRLSRKSKGFAAEYCPVCRQSTAMRIFEVRSYFHVYLVPLWFPKPRFYEPKCVDCRAVFQRELDCYSSFVQTPELDLAMQEETTPGFDDWLNGREAMELRLLSGDAPQHEREWHVLNVIESLEYMASKKTGWTLGRFFMACFWICLAVFILPAILVGIVLSIGLPPAVEMVIFGVAFILITITVCRVVLKKKSVYLPGLRGLLVQGLAPIDPTHEEIEFAKSRLSGYRLADSIETDNLLTQIAEYHAQR